MTARDWPRAMKARWTGTVSCGHLVLRGDRIYGQPGAFRCQACVLAALGTATPPRRPPV